MRLLMELDSWGEVHGCKGWLSVSKEGMDVCQTTPLALTIPACSCSLRERRLHRDGDGDSYETYPMATALYRNFTPVPSGTLTARNRSSSTRSGSSAYALSGRTNLSSPWPSSSGP